jgi:hypothetical protein
MVASPRLFGVWMLPSFSERVTPHDHRIARALLCRSMKMPPP